MSNSLRSAIDAAASVFTNSILSAIRGASLEELLAQAGGAARRRGGSEAGAARPAAGAASGRRAGRLKRRSAADIHKALEQVVGLVKKSKTGLRAEQIRAQLGMQSKEMPRILKEGVAKKQLRTKGQKRATTYFAR
jgi:hypothetical protein